MTSAAVRDRWLAFNRDLEGVVRSLYADKKGLVSTGVGNLLDALGKDGKPLPIDEAWARVRGKVVALPWTVYGAPASSAAIERAWRVVRGDSRAAALGWKYAAGLPANNIRLSLEDVHRLMFEKLDADNEILQARFPGFDDLHPDAQLAVHSMAWGLGPYFWQKYPRFSAAFDAGDYLSAAAECDMNPKEGTIIERNRRNRELLKNAALNGEPQAWPPGSAES